jgi:pseudouridine-5'-phosphate glycosidase
MSENLVMLSGEVEHAMKHDIPVVALESTIISHGLPRPRNLEIARALEEIVRSYGLCPATIAVVGGRARIGLESAELEFIANSDDIHKLATRDLAIALATGSNGATTVSATSHLAALAGIRVFATGGIGGIHRGYLDSFDESADLDTLSRTRITVVCAGVKSILDVAATLQRLETLNVSVVGFGTSRFPGFYLRDSGQPVGWRVDTVEVVAAILEEQERLAVAGALIVANPIPETDALDLELHDRVLADALAAADRENVSGQQITPFLLDFLARGTESASLEANLAAVRNNVHLASQIARATLGLRE